MSDLAKAISIDPAMTARVLRVVNSAFYGFPREIETITRAVSILGMQSIHDMVLATSVTSVFSKSVTEHHGHEALLEKKCLLWTCCA